MIMAGMRLWLTVALSVGAVLSTSDHQDGEFLYKQFPDDFLWGTATSSYQIEGAWDADGMLSCFLVIE